MGCLGWARGGFRHGSSSISILRQRERLGNVNFNMQLQHMYQVESDIILLRLEKKWLPRRAIIHKPQ